MRVQMWAFLFVVQSKVECVLPFPGRSTKQSSCIDLVAQRHFRSNSTVAVLTTGFYDIVPPSLNISYSTEETDSLVQLLSISSHFSLVTKKITGKHSCCPKRLKGKPAADYFIFVGRAKSVVRCIKLFCFRKLTNDRTHFVVYLETERLDARDIVENTLTTFWKHQHLSVAVLVGSQTEEVDIYTWSPFDAAEVKIVDKCNGESFRYNTPVFPRKLPLDLHGKVINIGVVVAPIATCNRIGGGYAGLEVEIIQAMASALNFTAAFYSSSALVRLNNSSLDGRKWKGAAGPWETILLRLLSGEVDVGIGGFLLWGKLFEDFDYTQPVAKDTYSFFATNDLILSGETERWMGIMSLEMIIVHALTTFAMYHLRRRVSGRNGNLGRTASTVWAVLTDVPVEFSSLSLRQQLLWVVVFFYVLNINAAYKSTMTSLLTSPMYTERIRTVTDMINSDLPKLAATALPEVVISSVFSSDEYGKLRKRLTICHEPLKTCLANFKSGRHYGVAAFSGDMTFLQYALPNKKFHRLDRSIRTSQIGMYTTKNFYLTRKMTMMILRSAQAGLLEFWLNSILKTKKVCDLRDQDWTVLQNAYANMSLSSNYSDDVDRPFSITNLYPAFLFLGLGLFVAGLVCIFEISSATSVCRSLCTTLRRGCRSSLD